MNWEALIVVCHFTLGLGVVLFVPTWIWIKRKQRAEAGRHPKVKLTKLGWVLLWTTLVVLLVGLVMDYIAPDSYVGQFVKMPAGRLLYLAIVAAVFWLLEILLKSCGIQLTKEN